MKGLIWLLHAGLMLNSHRWAQIVVLPELEWEHINAGKASYGSIIVTSHLNALTEHHDEAPEQCWEPKSNLLQKFRRNADVHNSNPCPPDASRSHFPVGGCTAVQSGKVQRMLVSQGFLGLIVKYAMRCRYRQVQSAACAS